METRGKMRAVCCPRAVLPRGLCCWVNKAEVVCGYSPSHLQKIPEMLYRGIPHWRYLPVSLFSHLSSGITQCLVTQTKVCVLPRYKIFYPPCYKSFLALHAPEGCALGLTLPPSRRLKFQTQQKRMRCTNAQSTASSLLFPREDWILSKVPQQETLSGSI